MIHLSKEQAEGFYAEHSERPFFGALVEFMTSGPICVQVLESENAVHERRVRTMRAGLAQDCQT